MMHWLPVALAAVSSSASQSCTPEPTRQRWLEARAREAAAFGSRARLAAAEVGRFTARGFDVRRVPADAWRDLLGPGTPLGRAVATPDAYQPERAVHRCEALRGKQCRSGRRALVRRRFLDARRGEPIEFWCSFDDAKFLDTGEGWSDARLASHLEEFERDAGCDMQRGINQCARPV